MAVDPAALPRHLQLCEFAAQCLRRLLPATAERPVQLDYAQQFVQLDLPEVQFRPQQFAIGIERIELGIHTADISYIRQPFPIFDRPNQRFLLHTAFSHPLVSDQGV